MLQPGFSQSVGDRKWGDFQKWGDQGNGYYENPVLPADYSDIDCIRVGDDYYAISSTFQFSPGMVVLHSKDMVNWSVAGHVVNDLTQISEQMNWTKMNRYGRGIWAGSIRYYQHRFWVYFGTPDEGYYMSTAKDVSGPWTPLHHVLNQAGWDDCCPFWDDDGQGYFAGTNSKNDYKTWLFRLTPDGKNIIRETGKIINKGSGREASKLYKINGWYYHLFSEYKPGIGRYLMMQRSKNIYGPYTEVRQLNHADTLFNEPNQGGLVKTAKGDWYFYTHHGTGDWAGRINSLLPVTWVDGWPIIGKAGTDGIGNMVWSGKKPVEGTPVVSPETNDEFDQKLLALQWEWNYQPRAEKWSLTERPGWLRLHSFKPLERDNLLKAGNTLTMRSMRTSSNEVIIKLDLTGMADGQKAGLCHFASPYYSSLGIVQKGSKRFLENKIADKIIEGPSIESKIVWLKTAWGLDGVSRYSYSADGDNYTDFGSPYQLAWGSYRGDRTGIYNYNNHSSQGFVDVDFFHYSYSKPGK